jgi:hypothetical protein
MLTIIAKKIVDIHYKWVDRNASLSAFMPVDNEYLSMNDFVQWCTCYSKGFPWYIRLYLLYPNAYYIEVRKALIWFSDNGFLKCFMNYTHQEIICDEIGYKQFSSLVFQLNIDPILIVKAKQNNPKRIEIIFSNDKV